MKYDRLIKAAEALRPLNDYPTPNYEKELQELVDALDELKPKTTRRQRNDYAGEVEMFLKYR